MFWWVSVIMTQAQQFLLAQVFLLTVKDSFNIWEGTQSSRWEASYASARNRDMLLPDCIVIICFCWLRAKMKLWLELKCRVIQASKRCSVFFQFVHISFWQIEKNTVFILFILRPSYHTFQPLFIQGRVRVCWRPTRENWQNLENFIYIFPFSFQDTFDEA